MNIIKKYNYLKLIVSIILIVIGLLFCIFSAHPNMDVFLGYLIASILLLISVLLIIFTFINQSKNFFMVLAYLLIIALSVIIFLFPRIFVLSIPIVIGVFLSGLGVIFIIKFIILKRVSLKSLFNLFQLIGCLILITVGILFCIFYHKIDVYITSFIIGIPIFALGIIGIILTVIGMMRHHKGVEIYVGDFNEKEIKDNQDKLKNNSKIKRKK